MSYVATSKTVLCIDHMESAELATGDDGSPFLVVRRCNQEPFVAAGDEATELFAAIQSETVGRRLAERPVVAFDNPRPDCLGVYI